MANSLIEDIMNEGPIKDGDNQQKQSNQQNQPKNKKSKKAIIIVLILILIVIIGAVVAIIFLSSQNDKKSNKQAFFEAVTKNNIEQIGSADLYEELLENLLSDSSNISTNIDISYATEDISVNNISLNIDSQNDIENLKTYSDMTLSYSNNDIFNLEFLANSEAFALKSEEIVSNFVGARYLYLLGIDSAEYNTTSSTEYYDDFEYEYDEDFVNSNIQSDATVSGDSIEIYKNILDRNLDESQFTSKEVTLEMGSGKVDCIEYTLTMSEKQFIDICKQLLEGFETDVDTVEIFTSILALYGYSETDFINEIDDLIAQLDSYEADENSNIIVKVYDNNGQTVKLSMQYSGITMEIEYEYGDNQNSVKITAIEDETGEGLSYKIANEKSSLTQNLILEISVIEDSLVNQMVSITIGVVKSGSNYTLDISLKYEDSANSVSVASASDIEFTEVNIEDLTSENCLFLDELSEEEQQNILNQIYERTQVVLAEKFSQLSFIDSNTNTTIVGQAETENGDDTSAKETVKQDLINAIQEEMTESLNNGENYTIQDLEGLEVEGHTVEIEISDSIAVVTIDGYTFNIDSEFNLSE